MSKTQVLEPWLHPVMHSDGSLDIDGARLDLVDGEPSPSDSFAECIHVQVDSLRRQKEWGSALPQMAGSVLDPRAAVGGRFV